MKITLKDFAQMNPESPEYSPRNQHYLIQGADPKYFLAQNAVQELNSAPMAASMQFNNIGNFAGNGSFVQSFCDVAYPSYDKIIVSDTGSFYGVGLNGLIPLGTLSSASTATGTVNVFNGKIWSTSASSLYSKTLDSVNGGWSTIGSFNSGGSSLSSHHILPFTPVGLMFYADSSGGAFSCHRILKAIDATNTITTAMDLGAGVNIVGLENYNSQYVSIAAAINNDNSDTPNNASKYMVWLWNGSSHLPQISIQSPGPIVDMKSINGTLYILVYERANQYALYYLSSKNFKRIQAIAIDSIKTGPFGGTKTGFTLSDYQGQPVVNLASKGQYIISANQKNILTPQNMDAVTMGGALNSIYGFAGTNVFAYGKTTAYSPIFYRSQWLPIQDPSLIKVKYATPPQGAGDSIQVTLDGYDEDGNASAALPLNPITSSTYYNGYKTPLDTQGFQGKVTRVTLLTTSGGTWQPIIRSIDVISSE